MSHTNEQCVECVECAICNETLNIRYKPKHVSVCGHVFHKKCFNNQIEPYCVCCGSLDTFKIIISKEMNKIKTLEKEYHRANVVARIKIHQFKKNTKILNKEIKMLLAENSIYEKNPSIPAVCDLLLENNDKIKIAIEQIELDKKGISQVEDYNISDAEKIFCNLRLAHNKLGDIRSGRITM